MNPPTTVTVTDPQGGRGTIDTVAWPLDGSRAEVLVQFEGGQQVLVPLELLVRQGDSSYRLTVDAAAWEHRRGAGADAREPPLVLPVIEETLAVDTRPVETGRVRIRKVVTEREELVDPPLLREEVVIERVPVNRVVEGPLPVRYEGDTMIISLLEEVLVVDTRLLLTEEVHITTRRAETYTPTRVTLRREDVTIERVDLERHEPHNQGQEESHGEDRDRTL
jgi:uncharacterized protein (TIGR02271 family)